MAIYSGELVRRNYEAKSDARVSIIDCINIDETNGGLLLDLVKRIHKVSREGKIVRILGATPGLQKVLTRICYSAHIEFSDA